MKDMEFVIVTGVSGSGKSTVVNVLEDVGYYCIDNMPPELILKFADITTVTAGSKAIEKVAFVTDIRGGNFFSQLYDTIKQLQKEQRNLKVLFVDASDETIIRRYKETRRKHPLDDQMKGNIEKAIQAERDMLANVKGISDYFIDSSFLSANQLREKVKSMFLTGDDEFMQIDIMSFGFKYGPMREADLVFDVRCLPNPYYVDELRPKTGLCTEVSSYVMKFEQSVQLKQKLEDLMDFLIPLYKKEGKSQLIIAFGCTGGKHRSVTFAENMMKYLSKKYHKVRISHRDINKYT